MEGVFGSRVPDGPRPGRGLARGTHTLWIAWLSLLCCAAAPADEWVEIPSGQCRIGSRAAPGNPPREYQTPGFRLGRHEVTVREFCDYLCGRAADWRDNHPQIRGSAGRWRPERGQGNRPVTYIDHHEAEAYCAWRSRRDGARIRLPDPEEWEYAARAGRSGVRFPWGWGDPDGKAVFNARSPGTVGSRGPQGFGVCDLAGNVFEWCRALDLNAAQARGGSWAERDAATLEVYRAAWFDPGYRDADVGFRLLMEGDPKDR